MTTTTPNLSVYLLGVGVAFFGVTVTDDLGVTASTYSTYAVSGDLRPTAVIATPACTYLGCGFDGSGSKDSDGTVSSYAWDFGDNTTSTDAKPAHTYTTAGTYTVTLTVTDNKGEKSVSASTEVQVVRVPNVAPTAVIATPACTYLVCGFDGSGSKDSDGTISSYAWNFGDNTTSTDAKPTHTYTVAGTYTVTLTVTDNEGVASTTVSTVVSPVRVPNVAPTAVIATPACTYLVCGFDGSGSTDDATISSYAWDFGDKTTSTDAKPAHTYTTAGTYTVTLTVTDNEGVASTTVSTVVSPVRVPNVAPTAVIATPACTYLVCRFDGSGSKESDGTISSYAWNFGDNTTSTDAKPAHTYTVAGTYTVTLTVTDNEGKPSTAATRTVIVAAAPASSCATAVAPKLDTTVSANQTTPASAFTSAALTTASGGELVLAFIAADGPQSANQAITSVTGGGLTWTLASRSNATFGTTEIWQAYAPAKLTKIAVKAALAVKSYTGSITLAAFSGAAKQVGATTSASGISKSPSASVIPKSCGSLVWASAHDWSNSANPTPATGQTLVAPYVAKNVHDSFWAQSVTAPTAKTAVTVADAISGNDRWAMAAVEIMPTASS